MKYQNILNLLIEFQLFKTGIPEIKFSDISVEFIEGFRKWLRQEKLNQSSTIEYKLKTFKSFINKGIKRQYYNYETHPFLQINVNKINKKGVTYLKKEDIEKLIKTNLREVYRGKKRFGEIITDERVLTDIRYKHEYTLDDCRDFWLFQFLGQGLRVSDLLTMRFNDLYIQDDKIRLKKVMVKTGKEIDIFLNIELIRILCKYLPKDHIEESKLKHLQSLYDNKIKKIKELEKYNNVDLTKLVSSNDENFKTLITINHKHIREFKPDFVFYKKIDNSQSEYWVSLGDVKKNLLTTELKVKSRLKEQYGNDVFVYDKQVEIQLNRDETHGDDEYNFYLRLIEKVEGKLRRTIKDFNDVKVESDNKIYSLVSNIINDLSKNKVTQTLFCFPILKNEHFKTIDKRNDFSKMTKEQYTKFSGGRVYYNRLLKVVSEQCELSTPLTSHLSRHTFTSLIIEVGENINLEDLRRTLGHSHLQTTSVYIHQFTSEKIDGINKQLVDFVYKR